MNSLALGQSYDCLSASEGILKNMGRTTNNKTPQSMIYVHNGVQFLGFMLCMNPANERRRDIVTSSLSAQAYTQNDPRSSVPL